MPKYYFGWYKWYGFIMCERWVDEMQITNCTVKVQITKDEWDGPLSILEERYKHLQSEIV